jgi:SAM-dependent methyltransferase
MLTAIKIAHHYSTHNHGLRAVISLYASALFNRRRWYNAVFDIKHNINTDMRIPPTELGFTDPQIQAHAKQYSASSPYAILRAINALTNHAGNIDKLGFVDYGCGAGRAMIAAAEAGFRNIIGVELAPKLLRICQENIANYSHENTLAELDVIEQDAANYIPPKDTAVFFFYVPFTTEFYCKAIENIAMSVNTHPRTVYVLDYAWSNVDFRRYNYQRLEQVEGINIYRLTPRRH